MNVVDDPLEKSLPFDANVEFWYDPRRIPSLSLGDNRRRSFSPLSPTDGTTTSLFLPPITLREDEKQGNTSESQTTNIKDDDHRLPKVSTTLPVVRRKTIFDASHHENSSIFYQPRAIRPPEGLKSRSRDKPFWCAPGVYLPNSVVRSLRKSVDVAPPRFIPPIVLDRLATRIIIRQTEDDEKKICDRKQTPEENLADQTVSNSSALIIEVNKASPEKRELPTLPSISGLMETLDKISRASSEATRTASPIQNEPIKQTQTDAIASTEKILTPISIPTSPAPAREEIPTETKEDEIEVSTREDIVDQEKVVEAVETDKVVVNEKVRAKEKRVVKTRKKRVVVAKPARKLQATTRVVRPKTKPTERVVRTKTPRTFYLQESVYVFTDIMLMLPHTHTHTRARARALHCVRDLLLQ